MVSIGKLMEKVLALAGRDIYRSDRALEITAHLSVEGYQAAVLFGFDHSLAALEIARRLLLQAEFRMMDIYAPMPDERFDIIFCIEVLEHLLYPDRALRNLTQLAPGGMLILAVPNGRYDHFAGHINFWSPESWRVFLETTCPSWEIETGLTGNGRLAGERHVNYALLRARE